MEKKRKKSKIDKSTEEKIKAAAEKIFMEKGYSGTRTRDIAKEAGINLALLNYYFRSKENLFGEIMMEKLKIFFDLIVDILNDESIALFEKIPNLVNKYSDLLIKEPNLPFFLLSELKQNPDFFATKLNVKHKIVEGAFGTFHSSIDKDGKEQMVQLITTFLGMTFFPFIAREVMQDMFDISEKDYTNMLEKRRKLIPLWANQIINTEIK